QLLHFAECLSFHPISFYSLYFVLVSCRPKCFPISSVSMRFFISITSISVILLATRRRPLLVLISKCHHMQVTHLLSSSLNCYLSISAENVSSHALQIVIF